MILVTKTSDQRMRVCVCCFFSCAWKVSLAAQRRWLESKAAAAVARFEGTDSLAKLAEEQEEQRLYRQVTPVSY